MTVSLSTIPKSDLKATLKSLRTYRLMFRQVGSRASAFFGVDPSTNYRVEYDSTMDMGLVESFAIGGFKKYFSLNLESKEIKFSPNTSLRSGVRLFVADDMVDITYKNIENTIKNTL